MTRVAFRNVVISLPTVSDRALAKEQVELFLSYPQSIKYASAPFYRPTPAKRVGTRKTDENEIIYSRTIQQNTKRQCTEMRDLILRRYSSKCPHYNHLHLP